MVFSCNKKKNKRHQVSFLRIKSRGLNSSQKNSQAECRGKIFNAAEKHVYIYRTENICVFVKNRKLKEKSLNKINPKIYTI